MYPESDLGSVLADVEEDKTACESVGSGIGDCEYREVTTFQTWSRFSLDHRPH